MRLERHVGGLTGERKLTYLREAGWREEGRTWRGPASDAEAVPVSRALHHQLTADLSAGLAKWGWKVADYSQRGYATMIDPEDQSRCSIPAALRRQARRDGCPVRELTYGLFLDSVLRRGLQPTSGS